MSENMTAGSSGANATDMDVHSEHIVYLVYSLFTQVFVNREINIYTMYIHLNPIMVRHMKATITQIESVVTPSGNSGHVVVPKAWIGKEAIVVLKEKRKERGKK
jgi:putative transposon-encoded protein